MSFSQEYLDQIASMMVNLSGQVKDATARDFAEAMISTVEMSLRRKLSGAEVILGSHLILTLAEQLNEIGKSRVAADEQKIGIEILNQINGKE